MKNLAKLYKLDGLTLISIQTAFYHLKQGEGLWAF